MNNYEQDLQMLKEQQMKKAQADLEAQQKQSLSNLEAEISQIKPTYYAKKNSANVQSQVESKNFAEYLANSGRSNSGIGSQYEMSRRNNLQSSLNSLNTEEANALTDANRRKTDVNNAYQSGLTSANAQIESDYITNLLNQRQLAWEREQQEKQFQESIRQYNEQLAYQKQQDAIANAQAWAKINGSGDYGFVDSYENFNNSNVMNAANSVIESIKGMGNTVSKSSRLNSSKTTPYKLSSKSAENWFNSNISQKEFTANDLERELNSAYSSGIISKSDVKGILKSYGLS